MTDQYYEVEVTREDEGFGFKFSGGQEDSVPIFVKYIDSDGPADRTELREDDEIVEINGVNTENMHHEEAKEQINSRGNSVKLRLKRISKSVHD